MPITKAKWTVGPRAATMVLIAQAQQLRAKLMLKGRHRPEKMVKKKLPDGAGLLAAVPSKNVSVDDSRAEKDFCAAIDKISGVFGRQRRAESTAAEHKMYMRLFDGWLVRRGHGTFVNVDVDEHGAFGGARLCELR